MKFQLRLLPLVLSIAISSVVLFGGWFAYQSMALKSPLSNIILDIEGVQKAETTFQGDQVIAQLTLSPDASIRNIIRSIQSEGSSIIGKRELKVEILNSSSPELDQWWSNALFDVAQAMETKRYGDIPKTLEHLKETGELSEIEVSAEMDETNVYIRLVHHDQSKFIILPRIPVQLGVWSGE